MDMLLYFIDSSLSLAVGHKTPDCPPVTHDTFLSGGLNAQLYKM